MIQDLHSHSYYSACGKDAPKAIIEAALNGQIEVFGISDHNYGIGDRKSNYINQIKLLKEEYKDRIKILCGIEVSTYPEQLPPEYEDFSEFDYCIIECIQNGDSVAKDVVDFAKNYKCRVGIAHTDLFEYCDKRSLEPLAFFTRLADNNIFWEMNVNFDSIHSWREHGYVKEFFTNKEQQKIVRASGIELSVGFDGHRVEDYSPQRIIDACRLIEKLGITLINI